MKLRNSGIIVADTNDRGLILMNKVANLPQIWINKEFEQTAKNRAASLGGMRLTEYIRHLVINDIESPRNLKRYDTGAGSLYTPLLRVTPEIREACEKRSNSFEGNLTEYLRQLIANDLVHSKVAKFQELK